jgi:CDP-glycerol glycerophosphotransferase (TagB/SpsB family)
LKLIRVCHGAGDRDVAWSSNISKFDYVMLPGPKHHSRMLELGLVRPENSAVIGYMKFDLLSNSDKPRLPFKDNKPVVLYNPHFDPYLSSWYDRGLEVLEYFAASKDFNLVFAPHIMLFQRKIHTSLSNKLVKWRKNLPAHLLNCDNIHIDTGSSASTDMTYTRAADIYLGDVSSQVYEFIAQPKPCIFLNTHNAKWQKNPQYKFWSMGPVVNSITDLDKSLHRCFETHTLYKLAQKHLFRASIDIQAKPSADRAAETLMTYMDIKPCIPEPLKKFG